MAVVVVVWLSPAASLTAGLPIPLSAEGRCCCFCGEAATTRCCRKRLGGRLYYSNIVIGPVRWPSPIPPWLL
eukprot:scaffold43000_cov71-Cyclotella_meneghiniana.AAC.6